VLNISVVVVCYNEEKKIAECIQSIVEQSYPADSVQLIIVDNESTDGTRDIIRSFTKDYRHIQLVTNPERNIAKSRNMGILASRHEKIAFLDADCIAPPDWLYHLATGWMLYGQTTRSLAAVGGSNRPPIDKSRFYRALDAFLDSYLGSHGSVQGRHFQADKRVPHLPTVNVMYDKAILQRVGGFDAGCGNIGEDQDLSFRLQDHGYGLMYLHRAFVLHRMRDHWWAWLKNMILYGKGRIWLFKKHPKRIQLHLLMPAAFAGSVLFLFLEPVRILWIIYFTLTLISSLWNTWQKKCLPLFPNVLLLYLITHFGYGVGEWMALFIKRPKPQYLDPS
jgi:glycosyltransferase involved in cell wall biosynthesis